MTSCCDDRLLIDEIVEVLRGKGLHGLARGFLTDREKAERILETVRSRLRRAQKIKGERTGGQLFRVRDGTSAADGQARPAGVPTEDDVRRAVPEPPGDAI